MCSAHVSLAETWDCLVLPWKQRYGSPVMPTALLAMWTAGQ